ncbi:GntR family transcriptional regulator [Austwickia chelonae]|uniref:GntR family transcriptional regulator n=1 Tax=Austwickia chelonae TaxID=100225 RepID=UPI000E273E17|nr:GntR family transcriptional regulator [Austwickia chelonae]
MPVPQETTPLRRGLLREDVYSRLRDAIVDGTLAPGEIVRDSELAQWLGVSRTPVREALLRLTAAGLIHARPGKSTVVADIDASAIRDAQAVVATMHRLAVAEAVADLTRADLEQMRQANRRFADAMARGDADAALAADDDFHAVPVHVCGNAALAAVLDQFTPVIRRVEKLRFSSILGHDSVELHAQLVDLCETGDVEGAAEISFQTWQTLAPLVDSIAPPNPYETPGMSVAQPFNL